ncbi:hypothetical protein NT06LI_1551 [Listeria innocua FSL J1-023]|nr:hypothetical protein NT06LI_1551 [Listeria innocua FSL J1-023]
MLETRLILLLIGWLLLRNVAPLLMMKTVFHFPTDELIILLFRRKMKH